MNFEMCYNVFNKQQIKNYFSKRQHKQKSPTFL